MTTLHPQLAQDCFVVGEFPLCVLLLMNDANYPWFILVPKREGITEIHQLSETDQHQLIHESSLLAKSLLQVFNGDKMNIGALGNVVPQLHIHHIVRYRNDPAWPAPVWGKVAALAYNQQTVDKIISKVKAVLGEEVEFKR